MNDEELGDAWTTLEPTVRPAPAHRRARVRVARRARHAARGRVARAVQGRAVLRARSCHGERGLDRHGDTARLVRARADVSVENDSPATASCVNMPTFQVPQDAMTGQTIHALIQATDNGAPPLTSFRRVVVTVKMPRTAATNNDRIRRVTMSGALTTGSRVGPTRSSRRCGQAGWARSIGRAAGCDSVGERSELRLRQRDVHDEPVDARRIREDEEPFRRAPALASWTALRRRPAQLLAHAGTDLLRRNGLERHGRGPVVADRAIQAPEVVAALHVGACDFECVLQLVGEQCGQVVWMCAGRKRDADEPRIRGRRGQPSRAVTARHRRPDLDVDDDGLRANLRRQRPGGRGSRDELPERAPSRAATHRGHCAAMAKSTMPLWRRPRAAPAGSPYRDAPGCRPEASTTRNSRERPLWRTFQFAGTNPGTGCWSRSRRLRRQRCSARWGRTAGGPLISAGVVWRACLCARGAPALLPGSRRTSRQMPAGRPHARDTSRGAMRSRRPAVSKGSIAASIRRSSARLADPSGRAAASEAHAASSGPKAGCADSRNPGANAARPSLRAASLKLAAAKYSRPRRLNSGGSSIVAYNAPTSCSVASSSASVVRS